MTDFDKLKAVFNRLQATWHKSDDINFTEFLGESTGGLTLGNFRGAFEEAQGRQPEESEDERLIDLHDKYQNRHINN